MSPALVSRRTDILALTNNISKHRLARRDGSRGVGCELCAQCREMHGLEVDSRCGRLGVGGRCFGGDRDLKTRVPRSDKG